MELKKMRDQILDDFRRLSPGAVCPEDREAYNRGWKEAMCGAWIIVNSVFDDAEDRKIPQNDPVNHPAHYCGKIEVIDFILDRGADFLIGNVLKYVSRAGRKSPDTEIQDLEKARWYLDKKIELLKEAEAEKQKQLAEALAWTE